MKMAKMGRPTDNPKFGAINVRLDAECLEILEKRLKTSTLSRSEWIRRAIKLMGVK